MARKYKPRTYQGHEWIDGDLAPADLAVSVDRRGAFEPGEDRIAKAWREARSYIARHPGDADLILRATEVHYGPEQE